MFKQTTVDFIGNNKFQFFNKVHSLSYPNSGRRNRFQNSGNNEFFQANNLLANASKKNSPVNVPDDLTKILPEFFVFPGTNVGIRFVVDVTTSAGVVFVSSVIFTGLMVE